jgi:tRNA-dihydrouridine synthase
MSLVSAHWELSKEVVSWIRENFGTVEQGGPVIILNGDIKTIEEGFEKWRMSGCDGVMIGRGVFGNPWLFGKKVKITELSLREVLLTAVEHAKRFERELPFKNFSIMKKHFKAYVHGFKGAKDLRMRMMEANTAAEVSRIVHKFLFWNRLKRLFLM